MPDGGTVFTVSLPVAKGTEVFLAEPAATPRSSSVADAGANPVAGCNILVVDDEESIRELVSDGLLARGARVDVAASGEEALCLLDTRGYEVVICDVNLRGVQPDAISGMELYSRLTNGLSISLHRQKPLFVFMTGELAEENTPENLPAGVRTLRKPFRISDLITVLNESLTSAASSGSGTPAVRSQLPS